MTQNKNAPGEFPTATAQPLCHLVEYAPGAVVSRTLAKGATGTLTLFAFDKDEGLSEHSAPFDAWVQLLDGRATLTIGGKPVEAVAGDLVLMPANVPHAVKATDRMKMLLTMFRESKA
jgi:quercetin dioxygenase-like cupin family protein